jgi:ceramide glucosyltransferase
VMEMTWPMPGVVGSVIGLLSIIGLAQTVAGWWLVRRFAAESRHAPAVSDATARPPVTVLKPLHGNEPLLERCLASICMQDYPEWQVVFGAQDPDDPAIRVVRLLQARYPAADIALVVNSGLHGPNRKIGNLINMLPAARHDILVIADSDLRVGRDYLAKLVAALAEPGTGLVTTLYAGLPAEQRLVTALGAMQITHGFLPGALLARAMGRRDCLGATMCLRRETLARIGGLRALVDHLADDNLLGALVRRLGLDVRLASTVPLTTVPETTFRALFRHELRWARTIRALVPVGFAASVLQYPLFWALVALPVSGGARAAWALFAAAWLIRGLAAAGIDRALKPMLPGLEFSCQVWLLPLRELLSVAVMLASYAGKHVDWRGHGLQAGGLPPPDANTPVLRRATHTRPFEGPLARLRD